MSSPIRLGFIGASPGASVAASWAARAHLPYLKSPRNNDLYKVVALQNSSKAAAETAAKEFELGSDVTCYGEPTSIAADPNVDVIAVSVNVPKHYDAVMPALHAGKDTFVEWPLARNLTDAEEMVKIAREKCLKTLVGLQARLNPSVLEAKKLVDNGVIGDVIGTTMHGYGIVSGETHPQAVAYGLPIEGGANILTVAFGHAIDALCFVLGELDYVQATLANRRPEFDLTDESGNVVGRGTKTSHDYVSVNGILANGGGVVTAVYQGGVNPSGGSGFVWKIEGTKGCIVLEAAIGYVQIWQPSVKLWLKGDKEGRDIDGLEWVGDDPSAAVGKAWTAFAAERRGEKSQKGVIANFEDALLRHRMIDAIYRSNEKGTRETYI